MEEISKLRDELYHSVRQSVQNNRPIEYDRLRDIVERAERLHRENINKPAI